jgi:multiple sugar transport system substrate-binding protein
MIRTTTAACIAALALVVAACGGGGSSSAPVSSGKAQGTINVWAWGNEGEILGKLTKDFEASNPGVKV